MYTLLCALLTITTAISAGSVGQRLDIQGTLLLQRILASEAKVIVQEGSSGSSKTISNAQAHLVWSMQERNKVYSVVRATLPALKKGALRDWKNVLEWANASHLFTVNKTDFTWTNVQTGTQIEFFAADDEQKGRGPRRDRLWMNEANEIRYEVYKQLAKRTRGTICLDYNPSMQKSYIYDHILTREDCEHIHSTYRINTFLSPDEIREIEVAVPVYQLPDGSRFTDWKLAGAPDGAILISGDPYEWGVFGLGLRGAPSEAIYPAVYEGPFPQDVPHVYGLDFGYTHAMVLLKLARVDRMGQDPDLHVDEVYHERLTLVEEMLEEMPKRGVGKRDLIIADSAAPDEIEKIRRAGYNIRAAAKGPGSVYSGIVWMKGHRLIFTPRSHRSKAQFQDYRWKKVHDIVQDEPVKLNDDAPDAGRYGAFTHWGRPQPAARRTESRFI